MLLRTFLKVRQKYRLRKLRSLGLHISDDCKIMGGVNFGSEPFLVSVGKRVTISGMVNFITHDGATCIFRHLPEYKNVIKFGRIVVNDNCFIGYGSIILPGVSIGPNSVVAAGSVVVKDVPPDSVVGGNPARLLMNIEEYAHKSLLNTPNYNEREYKYNKVKELLRLFPYPW